MFVDEFVEIGLNPQLISYYREIGYNIEKGQKKLLVKTRDIMKTSHYKVRIICDYCGDIFETEIRKYYTMIENTYCSKTCCKKCRSLKIKESNFNHFGYETPMQSEWFHNKAKETFEEKYGVDHVSKIPSVQQKVKATCLEKYGKERYLETEDAKEKRKKTNFEKYGVEYITQVDDVKDKIRNTNFQKYGVEYISQSEDVKRKIKETCMKKYGVPSYSMTDKSKAEKRARFMDIATVPSSKMQRHICDIVNGQLNYPWSEFFFDVLYSDWLDIEYDGKGHDLNVRRGQVTREEFEKREHSRTARIIKNGYKQLVLSNLTDSEIDEELLKSILSKGIFFLENFDDRYLRINLITGEISTTFM